MFRSLRATNFKSWRDTGEVRLGKLTGLFGANSSGKTSLLQLLLLLKQTAESPDRKRVLNTGDETTPVDLGTYFDLIHGHRSNAPLQVWLNWNLADRLEIPDPEGRGPLFRITDLRFHTEILETGVNGAIRPVVRRFSYEFDGQRFGMTREANPDGDGSRYELVSGDFTARRVRGRAWPLPEPVKCYGFPDEAVGYFQNTGFLPGLTLEFELALEDVVYLGPLRAKPRRTYLWAGEAPVDVGVDGYDTIAALLASREQGRVIRRGRGKRKQTVEESVAQWLQQMGLIHAFSLRPIAPNRKDYEVRVQQAAGGAEVLITDVGFGVSQILPVLVLCYYVPEGSTVILEQPEIHLHPRVQADLADVLVDVVRHRNLQVIVESHSEHLLRRIQRRIAEEELNAADASLYFCRMEGAASKIEELQLDGMGNITNWPSGFFGDEMGDLIAMTEAAARRSPGPGRKSG